jgi:hypothetical protein
MKYLTPTEDGAEEYMKSQKPLEKIEGGEG